MSESIGTNRESTLGPQVLQGLADELFEAEHLAQPIAPLTERHPELSIADAYRIQLFNEDRRGKTDRLLGYKVGLTSREARAHFGVDEPDLGHLRASMAVDSGGKIDPRGLIQPKIEGEIAFVMGRPLQGPGVEISQVLRAVNYVVGALEIVDSRIRDWKIRAADTIADNGSSARFVLGARRVAPGDLDLEHLGMALSKAGEVVLTGAGAASMGNPLLAVAFLANELGRLGRGLEAGDIVLSGSLGGMIPVAPGDRFSCEFLSLGTVAVSFHTERTE